MVEYRTFKRAAALQTSIKVTFRVQFSGNREAELVFIS